MKMVSGSKGQTGVLVILVIVVMFAIFIAGGFSSKANKKSQQSPEIVTSGVCCDTGDRDQCRPQTGAGQTFKFNDIEYGLLKSNVILREGVYHLKDSGEKFNDNPIIINTADGFIRLDGRQFVECGGGVNDQVYGPEGQCVPIPNDQLIYVCKDKCGPATGQFCDGSLAFPNLTCYGSRNTVYDVYFRLSNYPAPGVPDVIKNCNSASDPRNTGINAPQGGQFFVLPTETERENLQLSAFKIINVPPVQDSSPWISPWCKPAIYLYPEEKTDINVQIAPQGKLTLTIPKYPSDGWNVIAYPTGRIDYQNSTFEYLYYEAEIPDDKIKEPKDGFVVSYRDLAETFDALLPKLGLNGKETKEFKEYWIKALPESPYYYIGIVPQQTLDTIAPLSIQPRPDNIIRVTLYFRAFDKKIKVNSPKISTPNRSGFTVVEWGGIFKTDKNHPFSCLM